PRIHASTRCTGDLSAIASSSMPATASALLNKSCLVVTAREFIGLPTRRHHPIGLTPSSPLTRGLASPFDPAELRLIGAHEVAAEHLVEVVLRVPRQLVLLHHEHFPQPGLAARQAEALLALLERALDHVRLEAPQRALDRGAHAGHQRELVRTQVL